MIPFRVAGERCISGRQQASLRLRSERGRSVGKRRAVLHLNEGEQPALFGNKVELAGPSAQAPRQNRPAFRLERRGGTGFGGEAGGVPGQGRSRPSSTA